MSKIYQEQKPIFGCYFEIFGKVQGVYFCRYTLRHARNLGVCGWCAMSEDGTVKGHLEAPLVEINEMKFWLQNNGSPKSIIQRAEFTPTKEIAVYSTRSFSYRK